MNKLEKQIEKIIESYKMEYDKIMFSTGTIPRQRIIDWLKGSLTETGIRIATPLARVIATEIEKDYVRRDEIEINERKIKTIIRKNIMGFDLEFDSNYQFTGLSKKCKQFVRYLAKAISKADIIKEAGR